MSIIKVAVTTNRSAVPLNDTILNEIFTTLKICFRDFIYASCLRPLLLGRKGQTASWVEGKLLRLAEGIMGYTSNDLIWKGVDILKENGYVMNSVQIVGSRTDNNPYMYHIIMSKPFNLTKERNDGNLEYSLWLYLTGHIVSTSTEESQTYSDRKLGIGQITHQNLILS